jgi:hypothetical protein
MNVRNLLSLLACGAVALSLSGCGLFGSGSKAERPVAATGAQEYDPYAHTWRASNRVVTPPRSEPSTALAQQQEAAKRENSTLNKAGRAMTNTAGAVGRAVKKPLEWLPFGKKDETVPDDAKPAVATPKTAAQ